MSRTADQRPVIVGAGEITDRPATPLEGLEPLALAEEALLRAEADAGVPLIGEIGSLDLINVTSWRYRDPELQLCGRLGIAPARASYRPIGGETPVRALHEAAIAIAQGKVEVAAICGAEAQGTFNKAKREGVELRWTPYARDVPRPLSGVDQVHPAAVALGVRVPTTVYPFYEQATAAAWGQTPREARAESGALWARYSEVAAGNEGAWLRRPFDAKTIVTPGPDNRLVAWPYTKLMVANPSVNQGAALLLTSYGRARALGIAEDRMIFVLGGAAASEPRDFMARDQLVESHAQNEVLERALALAPDGGFDHLELYSCFPCVPKMARRSLGLGEDVCPTVAGGLTFHGAPLNNYMSHAAAAMVRRLRADGGTGLLYGQGEFVTKHHALLLAPAPGGDGLAAGYDVQQAADRRRGAVPPTLTEASGPAEVESCTILYDAGGEPEHGVVIVRLGDGGRAIARVPREDAAGLARLTDLDRGAIGAAGSLRQAGSVLEFGFR